MERAPGPSPVVCFGEFRLDLESGELHKNGSHVRIAPQPFRILVLLARRAGHVVTREEIQRQVWGDETFVDFEKSLNSCIKQIRAALADDAENPRYVETLPKRGYRFIASVTFDGNGQSHAVVPNTTADVAVPARSPARRRWLAVAMVATLAAAVGVGRWQPWRPRLSFQERDWVLITTFQNRTGEAIFDGMLEYALERELSNSRFVNVAPRARIGDALQLMKKPPNTPIDVAVGWEVCLRDGGIRALLNGQIEKAGTHYLLSASVMDPASGVSLASVSEEADSQDGILSAVQRLSDGVRETLGEQLPQIPPQNEKLEKATTQSLRALQLYSQGMAMVNQGMAAQAAALMEQATTEDPDFASAHIYLAHALSSLRRDAEAAPHYQRAFALAETTTDRERYFILGSYYGRFLKDYAKAAEAYEVLVRLYPNDFWGNDSLASLHSRQGWAAGDNEEAIKNFTRYGEMRPNSFATQVFAAWAIAVCDNSLVRARPFARRAEGLATPEAERRLHLDQAGWLQLLPALEYWIQGSAKTALAELQRTEKNGVPGNKEQKEAFASKVAGFYLALGQRRAAAERYARLEGPKEVASKAYQLGNYPLAKEYYRTMKDPGPASVVLMARLGLVREAERALPKLKGDPRWTERTIRIVRAELALARNQNQKALALLQEGMDGGRANPLTLNLGLQALATAWERQGDLTKAAEALEKASELRLRLVPANGDVWVRNRWRQAQLYRKLGRVAEARQIEGELRKLLAVADEDYPVLVQLKQIQERDARAASQQ